MLPEFEVAPETVYLNVTLGALFSATKLLRSIVMRPYEVGGFTGATELKVVPSVLNDHVLELNPVLVLCDA